uniref:Mediator of RNA polymerase II transcription subunit 13 n=1 Tax=Compsopogon caeruleus TaxID=31354 RepID=A0A7S1XCG5_9RHOD|mmetsp:Transcript_12896/g.26138  ORF Transcript_12896/g.26138 Transcript_12896/m.26138 type:complete len:1396 (+) Transcript_12896:206-4393(+)
MGTAEGGDSLSANYALTNVFAVTGLEDACYRTYRVRPGLTFPEVWKNAAGRPRDVNHIDALEERIKFLEFGVGLEIAATAAAVAMVNDTNKFFASSESLRDADDGSVLWVFGGSRTTEMEFDQLEDQINVVFEPVSRGVFRRKESREISDGVVPRSGVERALLAAVREAIFRAFARTGLTPVQDELIRPVDYNDIGSVSYKIKPFLSPSGDGSLLVMIAIGWSPFVPLRDADIDSPEPVEVSLSPFGMEATTCPRRIAGSSLSNNVLARWREAGLLATIQEPSEEECEDVPHTVIFVKLSNGQEVPVPRSLVLRAYRAKIESEQAGEKLGPKPIENLTVVETVFRHVWHGKKRPRSPSPDQNGCSPGKSESTLKPSNQSTAGLQESRLFKGPGIFVESNPELKDPSNSAIHLASLQNLKEQDHQKVDNVNYDEVSKLCELEEVEDYFNSGLDKGSTTIRKNNTKVEPVRKQVLREIPMEVDRSDPPSTVPESGNVQRNTAGPSTSRDEELKSLFADELRKCASAGTRSGLRSGNATGMISRSRINRITSNGALSSNILKRRSQGVRDRQILRNLYVPVAKIQMFGTRLVGIDSHVQTSETHDDDDDEGSSDDSEIDTEDECEVDEPRLQAATFVAPASNHQTVISSVAVDCLSACAALKYKDQRSNQLESLMASSRAKDHYALSTCATKVSLAAVLTLIDAQICGDMDMWLWSPFRKLLNKNPRERRLDPAVIRRSLFGVLRIFRDGRFGLSWKGPIEDGLALSGPLSLNEVPTTHVVLEVGRVCVGLDGDWLEASPQILPLWEKVGLEPYSGRKHVSYIVLAPKILATAAAVFFRDLGTMYEECSFGLHQAASLDSIILIGDGNDRIDAFYDVEDRDHVFPNEAEAKLLDRYSDAAAGVALKLTRHGGGNGGRLLVYVVSPFPAAHQMANARLLAALAPLAGIGRGGQGSGLVPWQDPQTAQELASKLPATIRLISPDLVSSQEMVSDGLPLRPQLMKALACSVYNSLKGKQLNASPDVDAILSSCGSVAKSKSEMMSPVTPEQAVCSPGSAVPTAVAGGGMAVDTTDELAEFSLAKSGSSSLYEPHAVLAGVGSHVGEYGADGGLVLLLSYCYVSSCMRYVCTLSDSRGDVMDSFVSPVLESESQEGRLKMFSLMWDRCSRWMVSFVKVVRLVVIKFGFLTESEVNDWIFFIEGQKERWVGAGIDISPSLRFGGSFKSRESPANQGEKPMRERSTDSPFCDSEKVPCSISVVSAQETNCLQLLDGKDREARAVALLMGREDAASEACVFVSELGDGKVAPTLLSLWCHFGLPMEDDNREDCPWDSYDVSRILLRIAENFQELRSLSIPPSWPSSRWSGRWPRHIRALDDMQRTVSAVFSVKPSPSLPRAATSS